MRWAAALLALFGCGEVRDFVGAPTGSRGTELVMDRAGGPIFVLDLAAPTPLLFQREDAPVELDAFVYDASPAALGLEVGALGEQAGLRLSGPDSAHRLGALGWGPHPDPASSPLWGRRTRHDVASCSGAGGCYFSEEDRCEVPCRAPPAPPRPPTPPTPAARPHLECPTGWEAEPTRTATTCRPVVDLDACVVAGDFGYPGALACEPLLAPTAGWPTAPATDKPIVYVASGGMGDGSGPDRALGSLQAAIDRHPGQAIVALVESGRYEVSGDAIAPGTEVHASSPLRASAIVVGSITGRWRGLTVRQQGARLHARGALRLESTSFDGDTLVVDPGATVALERVRQLTSSLALELAPGAEVSIERSDVLLAGAEVAAGAELRVSESRLQVAAGLVVGGRLALDRAWIEARPEGTSTTPLVSVAGPGAALAIERSRLRAARRLTAALVEVAGGARATLAEVTLDVDALPPRGDGLRVSGGRLGARDLVVRGGHRGLVVEGSPELVLARVALEGLDNGGLWVESSSVAAADLTVAGVGRQGGLPGRGVRLVDGAKAVLDRVEVSGAAEWGIALGDAHQVQATLRDLSIDGPKHGVLVYGHNTLAVFERARVRAGGLAFKSYAAAALTDVELIATSSASDDAVMRLCQRIPSQIEGLRVDGGGRRAALIDLVASAGFTGVYADLELRRGAVGVLFQPFSVSKLLLDRVALGDVGIGLSLRGRMPSSVWASSPDPCDREFEDPLRAPERGAGFPAVVAFRGAMTRVGTCLAAATREDRCGFDAEGLVVDAVEECVRCER